MPDFEPRKLPRQERSRATYEAMLEACARLLREEGYAAPTTTGVAARAGVGIGTLCEFFPNKESIVAAPIEQLIARMLSQAVLEIAFAEPGAPDTETLTRELVRLARRMTRDSEG